MSLVAAASLEEAFLVLCPGASLTLAAPGSAAAEARGIARLDHADDALRFLGSLPFGRGLGRRHRRDPTGQDLAEPPRRRIRVGRGGTARSGARGPVTLCAAF